MNAENNIPDLLTEKLPCQPLSRGVLCYPTGVRSSVIKRGTSI